MADALECPVCLTLPAGDVHQCHNGHCYCVECWDELASPRRCPECRQPLPQLNRNRDREQRIAALPAQCDHCAEATIRGEKAAHESACPQRPVNCMGAAAGCGWVGVAAGQKAHEAACPLAGCQRLVAPLQALCARLQADNQQLSAQNEQLHVRCDGLTAQNQRLQARVAALEPLRVQNQQLQHRVGALEPLVGRVREIEGDEGTGGRRPRQRQRVGPAPHDAPPSGAAVAAMGMVEVVAALRAHVEVTRVAEVACNRIGQLCQHRLAAAEVGAGGGAEAAAAAAAAGALEAVVAAMRTHPQAVGRSVHEASTPDVLSGGPALPLGLDYTVLCYG